MEDVEVPHYFTCPISLQIMIDPVTVITGITYDRDSIENWLYQIQNPTCPVTKQPIPLHSDLTPNHTLRRLIQAWCAENSSRGINRIPTPKPPLTKDQILKLLKDLPRQPHRRQLKIIKQLQLLAVENGRNSQLMVEAGVFDHMLSFIVTCFDQNNQSTEGLHEALSVINLLRPRVRPTELDRVRVKTNRVMDSLAWILGCSDVENHVKGEVLTLLKLFVDNYSNPSEIGRLNPQFFEYVTGVLKRRVGDDNIDAVLEITMKICPWGRNRVILVESGAVFELVEIGFGSNVRKTIEMVLGVLFQLCCCAEGRAEFLRHKGSIFVVSSRISRLSPAADDWAVKILSLICRFSGTKQVLREMLEVGAVFKLCGLLQTECDHHLKEKAREILRSHSEEWKNSPCIGDSHCYPNPRRS